MTTTAAGAVAAPAEAATPGAGSGAIGGITAPQPPAAPVSTDLAPMENSDQATNAQQAAMTAAAAKARSTRSPVPVDALTTETEQVAARPEGGFAFTGNAQPVRTRQHGAWRPVDVTLRVGADGRLSPVATAYGNLSLSAGGSGPLAVTSDGAASYSVTWPDRLPKPVVSGDTATYREALPGVDLTVHATSTGGFSEVLVVKSAAAAKNPALAALHLGAAVHGGRYAPALAPDGVQVTAPSGHVLDTGTPLMWDSRQAAGDRSDTRHASVAARVGAVRTSRAANALTLTPDHDMLSDPSTVYPVYVDPTFNWHPAAATKPAFDEVKQGSPCNGASYYNNTGSAGNNGNLGVGYNGWNGGCVGDEHAYYQWSLPHSIWDATIHTATVNATETYASSCSTTSTVNLHWTGAINSGTDWNKRPAYVANGLNVGVSFASAENPSSCPDQGFVTHGFNIQSTIAKASTGHWSTFTAALAQDSTESSKNRNAFKRFSDNPTLEIFYDHKPSTPGTANLTAVTGSKSSGCATAAPYPVVGKTIATNTPVLSAKIGDPDGDAMRATFKYWVDGSTTTATGLSGDNLANNSTAKFSLPAAFTSALKNGQTVDWNVTVTDGELTSTASSTCHFTAEPTAPLEPTIVSADGNYPDQDDDATAGVVGKPAGTSGQFSITNNGTTATKFAWGLDVPPATANPPATQTITATGNAATLTVTPKSPGPHTLWVYAIDAAGDVSTMTAYRFEADHLPAISCTSLAACYNNVSITADNNTAAGNADGANSFSATDLTNYGWTTGGRVVINGAPITLPSFGAGQNDNVLASGQQVNYSYTAPATGPSALVFLTSSANSGGRNPGAIENDVTAPYVAAGAPVASIYCFDSSDPAAYCAPHGAINYSDGTSVPYFLTVPDWSTGPNDLAVAVFPHRNSAGSSTPTVKPMKMYAFSVPVAKGKTITSVALPEVSAAAAGNQALHVFGIGARNTTTGTIQANGVTTAAPAGKTWTGAWASPTEVNGNFNTGAVNFSNQTFRMALKPSISGTTLRVKLDNALGTSKLLIGHATVALDGGTPPAVTPSGGFTNLTFGGAAGVTVPAGGMVYSDPLNYTVTANKWLLVSFNITNSVPFIPEHSWASDTDHGYTTAPGSGDKTTDATTTAWAGNNTHDGNFTDILTDLDVATTGTPTQVVFGDGLVDAWQPNTAPNGTTGTRLSDVLAAASPSTPTPFGTLAEGIESNYVMTDDPQINPDNKRVFGGPSALSRVDRDILDQPGVDTVVLDEGLEDVLNGRSSDDLDANGYPELLAYFQGNDLDTIVVGLHPCDGYAGDGATVGSTNDPCTAAVDNERTMVNGWLSSGPLGMTYATSPSLAYIDPDATVGVPDSANGLTKLDPNAAVATDHVNLSDSGYAALTTAYLGAQDTWTLDDGDYDPDAISLGDSAADDTNPYLADNVPFPADLTGGTTWTTDPTRGTVLTLDGTTGGASTETGPVVNTAGSYSVSAWAKLSGNAADAVIVSQADTTNRPFSLRYDKALNAWTFSVATTATGTGTTAVHGAAPTLNAWTHLVGTYNAGSHTLTLYVNGTSVATASYGTPWTSSGVLELGHAGATAWFPGALSNISAWDYALTPTQVKALYQQIS